MNRENDDNYYVLQQEDAEKSFTEMYNQYSVPIFANVLKLVKDPEIAEEIVQEVFTAFWQKWADIRVEKSLEAYLYRMSANKVIDFFRAIQSNRAMKARFTILAVEHYSHIEEALHYRESEQLLQKALASLSPQQQRVYQLCKTDGHSYKEAAELLHISQHTVKEHLTKANQTIRNYLIANMDKSIPLLVWAMLKK